MPNCKPFQLTPRPLLIFHRFLSLNTLTIVQENLTTDPSLRYQVSGPRRDENVEKRVEFTRGWIQV
jgi:hypothetical protein